MGVCSRCENTICFDTFEVGGGSTPGSVENGKYMVPLTHAILEHLKVPAYDLSAVISDKGIAFSNGSEFSFGRHPSYQHSEGTDGCNMHTLGFIERLNLLRAHGFSMTWVDLLNRRE